MSNEALKELGKSFMSFANLFTVLSFVNIYLQQVHINILAITITAYIYVSCHIIGYILIRMGEGNNV